MAEERAQIEESAARLKVIGALQPGVDPRTLLVGLYHEGPIRATKIKATVEVTLVEWPSGRAIKVLKKLHGTWDSMDSDPKVPDDERKLVQELVEDAPLTFQELEKTKKTIKISVHLDYFNGFQPVKDFQCLEWLPKYAYKGTDAEAGGFEDYGGGPGLIPCDQFNDAIKDAEIHKDARNES